MILLHLLSLLFFIRCTNSANILGIFHIPVFSHQQLGLKLFYELAARGHEVTCVLPEEFVPKQPIKNFKVVKISNFFEDRSYDAFNKLNMGALRKIISDDMLGLMFTEAALNQTSVKNLLRSNEKFDLVIMEQFLNEAFRGFCYHFKTHCLLVSTIGTYIAMDESANGQP